MYGTRLAIRGATARRTAEMCQPTTASTTPVATRRSVIAAARSGGPDPSTTRRRSSRPSRPPAALISSAARRAQDWHEGPKIPAEPCSGTSRPISIVGRGALRDVCSEHLRPPTATAIL